MLDAYEIQVENGTLIALIALAAAKACERRRRDEGIAAREPEAEEDGRHERCDVSESADSGMAAMAARRIGRCSAGRFCPVSRKSHLEQWSRPPGYPRTPARSSGAD